MGQLLWGIKWVACKAEAPKTTGPKGRLPSQIHTSVKMPAGLPGHGSYSKPACTHAADRYR
eukprot:1025883-Pelagomonas_calceolata.AAC.1